MISNIPVHLEYYSKYCNFFNPKIEGDLETKIIQYYSKDDFNYDLNNLRTFKSVALDYLEHYNQINNSL